MPRISIVVPTRNRRDTVMRLVHSLSLQTGVEVQLVIVVEGSTDGTLEALATCGIPNLEVVHHPDPCGVSAARNAGLARAEGDFVGFIDDDDFWSPNRASDAIAALQSNAQGAAWSCCGAANVNGGMKVTGLHPPPVAETVAADLYRCNSLPGGGSAVVARTELIRAAGGFSSEFADLADWDLWFRLIRMSPLAVVSKYQIAYTIDLLTPSFTHVARSYEELTRLRETHGFGVAGNADFDPGIWNRWIVGHYRRARDRSGMGRMWFREAVRTGSPLALGRSIGSWVLPMHVQLMILKTLQRRLARKLDPVEVRTVERWLADIDDMPLKTPR